VLFALLKIISVNVPLIFIFFFLNKHMNILDYLSSLDITLLVIVSCLGIIPLYHIITKTGPSLKELNDSRNKNDLC